MAASDAKSVLAAGTQKIRDAWIRVEERLTSKPAQIATSVTTVRQVEGLTCEVEQDSWKLRVDMQEKYGGNGAGPDPGVLGRGAFGSCLVIAYLMQAARDGIEIESLEVEVQADYEAGAAFGVGETRAGYAEIRYIVRVKSGTPRDEIERMLDKAEARAGYLNVFRDPVLVRRETQVVSD